MKVRRCPGAFALAFCDRINYKNIMPQRTPAGDKKLEIKKYPNRRYYDATHSRHLTLEEIRSLIQQGYDITVTDAKTGADITALVLTQIILELETAKLDSFPVPLLVRLIRMNDQLTKEFIEKYFNQALGSFLEYQQQVEDQIRNAQGLPASFPSVSAWTKAMLGPLAAGGTRRAAPESASPSPAAGAADPEADLRKLVRHLQKEVSELKSAGKKKLKRRGAPRRRTS
jgi:polyhydroxyalkanoate synthesis repressor PhaR